MDFGGHPFTLRHLSAYTEAAEQLGFRALAVNDHLVFDVSWLDGPTALAAMVERSGTMTLATTVTLPVIRGPVPTAKTLSAIDRLSGGKLLVAAGPGSSKADFDAVGVDFDQRWARFDESVAVLRALWRPGDKPFFGRFYSTQGITLLPPPAQQGGPPIWIGSWGSEAGLRRVARLADGWLASAYNTTPTTFNAAWTRLRALLPAHGKVPDDFPNAIATMWFFITDNRAEAERVLQERLAPRIHRPEAVLRERLPIGPAELFAQKLVAFAAAGVKRVFVWPIADEVRQLELFWETVRPAISKR